MLWGAHRIVAGDKPPANDSGSGVAIFLSERLAAARQQDSEGTGLGSRLCWVSFASYYCSTTAM
eukprot:SAG25_NODE_79_length_16803_cov_43.538194_2_plen_64_part_00